MFVVVATVEMHDTNNSQSINVHTTIYKAQLTDSSYSAWNSSWEDLRKFIRWRTFRTSNLPMRTNKLSSSISLAESGLWLSCIVLPTGSLALTFPAVCPLLAPLWTVVLAVFAFLSKNAIRDCTDGATASSGEALGENCCGTLEAPGLAPVAGRKRFEAPSMTPIGGVVVVVGWVICSFTWGDVWADSLLTDTRLSLLQHTHTHMHMTKTSKYVR